MGPPATWGPCRRRLPKSLTRAGRPTKPTAPPTFARQQKAAAAVSLVAWVLMSGPRLHRALRVFLSLSPFRAPFTMLTCIGPCLCAAFGSSTGHGVVKVHMVARDVAPLVAPRAVAIKPILVLRL